MYARYASEMLQESSAEEINHHNVVRLVAVRFVETYFLFLKTSERIATAKATHVTNVAHKRSRKRIGSVQPGSANDVTRVRNQHPSTHLTDAIYNRL